MADDPIASPPKSRMKRLVLIGSASAASLLVVSATFVVVIMKVPKVHDLWCHNVGTFCAKEVAKAEAPPPKPVPAGNCPDFKIMGSLKPRNPDDAVWTMMADVNGKVLLSEGIEAASGKSSVACFNGQFLASFTEMSNGLTYQCQGALNGHGYSGVCSFSDTGPHDVSGIFFN